MDENNLTLTNIGEGIVEELEIPISGIVNPRPCPYTGEGDDSFHVSLKFLSTCHLAMGVEGPLLQNTKGPLLVLAAVKACKASAVFRRQQIKNRGLGIIVLHNNGITHGVTQE